MLTPIKAPLYYAQVEPITPTVDRPTGNDSPSILLNDGDMQYSYIVKVLDGDGKKGYKVHKLRTSKHFTSCMEIKDQLQESLKEHLSCDKFDIGYIEAGRQGIRGKQGGFSVQRTLMICTNHTSLLAKQKLYCGVMDGDRLQGKKGNPLLQKKMKVAVKNCEHPVGRQFVKQWMK